MTMKPTAMPVYRAAANSILRSFLSTSKRHLIITGRRGIGKSTLLGELLALPYFSLNEFTSDDNSNSDFSVPISHTSPEIPENILHNFPGFTTHAFPKEHVELKDNQTGRITRIGFYNPAKQKNSNQMMPDRNGFLGAGLDSINRALESPSAFAVIDELGYLESSCPEFCDAIFKLFDSKRVIAVLRSQSTPFLDALRSRDDVFVYDLDHPVLPVGCVIMASGLGKRFGSNKLMADFNGTPLISRILSASDGNFFAARVVVTRSPGVEAFCKAQKIPVLLHEMPYRNHTVRLGLSTLLKEHPELSGCLFALGDQPLLTKETLEAMVIAFSHDAAISETHTSSILRLASVSAEESITPGNPILFGNRYFDELLTLPDNHGGNALLKRYPDSVQYFPAKSPLELTDADTPEELDRLKKYPLT